MRYLKEYKLWEQSKELTKNQVDFLNRSIMPLQSVNPVTGTWSVNSEGLVDVDGNFDCAREGLNNFQGIRFGKISGSFNCSENSLSSLEGAPREVGGGFYCSENQLTSLEGAPREVGGDFDCSYNQLTSLKGAPREVGGNFYCHRNQLTSLKGAPRGVRRDFYCHRNQLTSLEGAPQEVRWDFYCESNPISDQTIELICQKMMENPDLGYGAILASLQSRIPREDWEKLDKSSMDKMNQTRKKVYGMLGGIGGI